MRMENDTSGAQAGAEDAVSGAFQMGLSGPHIPINLKEVKSAQSEKQEEGAGKRDVPGTPALAPPAPLAR